MTDHIIFCTCILRECNRASSQNKLAPTGAILQQCKILTATTVAERTSGILPTQGRLFPVIGVQCTIQAGINACGHGHIGGHTRSTKQSIEYSFHYLHAEAAWYFWA